MQDIIVALYDEHAAAVRVRTALVEDGFPTDRLEVTSPVEHRQADKSPADSFGVKVLEYFRTLSADDKDRQRLNRFAQAVIQGASALTVHPRGEEEIQRAEKILDLEGPREVYRYLPEDTGHVIDRKIERAASTPER